MLVLPLLLVACQDSVVDDDPPAGTDSGTPDDTGGTTDSVPLRDASFLADVHPILFEVCAGCHYSEPAGLALVGEDPTVHLVDVPSTQAPGLDRVEPGNPEASYLWHKLSGTHRAAGGEGTAMPPPDAVEDDPDFYRALTESELDTVYAWIVGGARP